MFVFNYIVPSCLDQDEDCHSGKGSTADSTKQGDKAFNQDVDAKAAVAAGVFNKLPVSLNISSFQGKQGQ